MEYRYTIYDGNPSLGMCDILAEGFIEADSNEEAANELFDLLEDWCENVNGDYSCDYNLWGDLELDDIIVKRIPCLVPTGVLNLED